MSAEAPFTRAEWAIQAQMVREDLVQLRQDFRTDLAAAVQPILDRLDILNGRTRTNEIAIAVLQAKIAVVGAVFGFGAGTVGAVVGSLVHEWLSR